MELIKLFNLQGSLFIMILAGAVLKRKGIIDEPGKRCLTDLCVNIIIPCNIVKSCLIEFDISIMKACGLLLAVGIVMQLLCVFLNRFLFDGFEEHQKKVLQYLSLIHISTLQINISNSLLQRASVHPGPNFSARIMKPLRIKPKSVLINCFRLTLL